MWTPPARLGEKLIPIRKDKRIRDSQRAGHHQADWEANELPQGEIDDFETAREPPDTTSQIRRQMNCHKGKQINSGHGEPDTTIWTKPDTSLREK